jgi:hypothetical protein
MQATCRHRPSRPQRGSTTPVLPPSLLSPALLLRSHSTLCCGQAGPRRRARSARRSTPRSQRRWILKRHHRAEASGAVPVDPRTVTSICSSVTSDSLDASAAPAQASSATAASARNAWERAIAYDCRVVRRRTTNSNLNRVTARGFPVLTVLFCGGGPQTMALSATGHYCPGGPKPKRPPWAAWRRAAWSRDTCWAAGGSRRSARCAPGSACRRPGPPTRGGMRVAAARRRCACGTPAAQGE